MELIIWLEQVEIWRLLREEHSKPKQEKPEQTESEEPSEVRYPAGYQPILAAS